MLISETFKADGIAVSSYVYQSAPISIGCTISLISVF
jgi:hypothetical protein